MSKYLKAYKNFRAIAQKNNEKLEQKARDYFGGGVNNESISNFMVEASQDEQWLSEFNQTLKLGKDNEIKKYNEDDLRAQFAIVAPELSKDEVDSKLATFATTGSDVSGSNVAIDGILPTNILDVDEYLFNNDAGVLNEVTKITGALGDTQLPEFDVYPTPTKVAEAGTTTDVNFARRDAVDYKLNPNIKVQVSTQINELGLLKGTAAYFATLRRAMVREVQNELVKQIFNGTNGTNQFHGILQAIIPATIANKRGSFDVTADTNIAAEANKFKKLVLMLGTLPSNLSEAEQSEYFWVMNRNTWYQSIIPAVDSYNRYYNEAIMNGVPVLVGPGGLPVKLVSKNALADGTAALVPMKDYFLDLPEGIQLKDDGGIVNFNAGITLVKSYVFADGGYIRNFMRTSGYTTGSDDNRDRNKWRFITGL
jgi:hypothetical protein